MIHKVFTVDISDDGVLTGSSDGTQVMTRSEAKAIMSFLISHAVRIGVLVGIESDSEIDPILRLTIKMAMTSKEKLN